MKLGTAQFDDEGDGYTLTLSDAAADERQFVKSETEVELSEREAQGLIAIMSAVLSDDPHDYVSLKSGDRPIRLRTHGEPGIDAEYLHLDVDEARERAFALLLASGDEENLAVALGGEP